MKNFFKSALVLLSCAVCATVCVLFAGCGTDFKSLYKDNEAIWSRSGTLGIDYTVSTYNADCETETGPYTVSVSSKGFSGINTIHNITVEPGREPSVFYIEFTEFRMYKGKLKVYLTRDESVWDIFSAELTPGYDEILCSATLYDDNYKDVYGEEYFNEHFAGDWNVKIVGVDADFDFKLQFIAERDVSGSENPPVDPNPPVSSSSNFEKIKTAYANAGYTVDLKSDDVDASMQAVINQTKELYSQLGYNLCYIGKNLNNALNTELYMLISTDSEANTDTIASAYEGTYKYAKNGKDIIISIWPMGTPNFTPFNQGIA